jgi:hypothetical protein
VSRVRPAASVLAAAGAAFLLAGALLGLHRPTGAPPRDLGVVPAAAPVTALSPAATTRTPTAADVGSLARSHGQVTVPPSPPVTVRLPGGRRAVVKPIGTGRDGALDPPERVTQVGWWQGGASVGDPAGSIVLAGHVDAASQGVGVFAQLWTARPGQIVQLSTAGGREVHYRITGRRSYPRSRPLPAGLFSSDVAARLVLITCAGRFDPRTAHYADSLAVFAVPV